MSIWQNVHLRKCHLGKYPFGEMSFREVSIWEMSVWVTVHLGNCPSGNCPSGKSPLGEKYVWEMPFQELSGYQLNICFSFYQGKLSFSNNDCDTQPFAFYYIAKTSSLDYKFPVFQDNYLNKLCIKKIVKTLQT